MVDRLSIARLLALVTTTCVAALGLGLAVACDGEVRALESNQQAPSPAHLEDPTSPGDESKPVGGGPVEEAEENPDGHIDNGQAGDDGERDDEPADNVPSEENGSAPVDDTASETSPNNESTTPDDDSHDEEAPGEEHWRAPVRGSGGDTPPDFIAPSDPKQV
jgi:hypothetical protein